MNDQGSKKILFNKSSLVNLKAELLKKHEEVQEKKRLPQNKLENFKPPPSKPTASEEKSSKIDKKTFKDSLQAIDLEELEAIKKTKLALVKKAKLYEHLSNPVGESKLAKRFLVDFSTKKQLEKLEEPSETEDLESVDNFEDDDSEWTEFTDCLGRTRKCLKVDLDIYKEKDEDLKESMNKNKLPEDVEIPKNIEKPLLVQKNNDYLQMLREKWEQQERELLKKGMDIHYQDLLFDEARIHGVGYFAFSTDEAERRKQMEELIKRREETLRAQKATEEKRRKQDDLVAARLKAARALQRLRAGLPPEEAEESPKDFNACLLDFLNKQKQEADARAIEQEKKIKEELEKERQKLREAYVREWDLGKEGVKRKVKKFRELTQEEYEEQQRDKRIDEFAPVEPSSTKSGNFAFDNHGRTLNIDEPTTSKSWSDVRPKRKTPPPPDISNIEDQKGLFFTTSKKPQSNMKYKNFVKAQEITPIVNELDDYKGNVGVQETGKIKAGMSSVEVPPPPTYDYYGPVPKLPKFSKPFESDIREAFAQGAKSLEPKASNRHLPDKYDFSHE